MYNCIKKIILLSLVFLLVACSKNERDKVTLQLKWVAQTSFGGYYAALDKGYYEKEGLDVTIGTGSNVLSSSYILNSGKVEFANDWLPSALNKIDKGLNLVNIAQIFTRPGMAVISWKDSGITTIKHMRSKKVGVWCCGGEFDLFAALKLNDIDPYNPSEVKIISQGLNMSQFINQELNVASAMIYNELGQVLLSKNPHTGNYITLQELNVIKMSDVGTGMLEDGIYVRQSWISSKKNQNIAKRFLRATFRGWVFCRDHQEECLQIVLNHDPKLNHALQRWQLNEVNNLIWPAPLGIGVMDMAKYNETVNLCLKTSIIAKSPPDSAVRTDLARLALEDLKKSGIDIYGMHYSKAFTPLPGA